MDAKDSDFLMMEIRENVGNIESKLVASAIHTHWRISKTHPNNVIMRWYKTLLTFNILTFNIFDIQHCWNFTLDTWPYQCLQYQYLIYWRKNQSLTYWTIWIEEMLAHLKTELYWVEAVWCKVYLNFYYNSIWLVCHDCVFDHNISFRCYICLVFCVLLFKLHRGLPSPSISIMVGAGVGILVLGLVGWLVLWCFCAFETVVIGNAPPAKSSAASS